MKYFIILLITIFGVAPVCGQDLLSEADTCFKHGNYACAQAKYKEIFGNATGKEKQLIEIKMKRTEWCLQHLDPANRAFENGQYAEAKDHYHSVLQTNPNDTHAKERVSKCEELLRAPTELTVSDANLTFLSSGGNKTVTVATNEDSYTINDLPDWCSVTKQSKSFTVACNPNSTKKTRTASLTIAAGDKSTQITINQLGVSVSLKVSTNDINFPTLGGNYSIKVTTNTDYNVTHLPSWCSVATYSNYFVITCDSYSGAYSRSEMFYVKAGDKEEKIKVSQSGSQASAFKVSTQNILFTSSGGTQSVTVTTDDGSYDITLLPSWCSVTKYSNYFNIACESHSGSSARTGWFKVKSGNKEVQIDVTQSAITYVSSYKCFNCPNAYYPFGVTFGFSHIDYTDEFKFNGTQIGFRFEPLYRYGFGFHTGIFYEYYDNENPDDDDYDAIVNILNLQLHLEYRLNFSKYFNLFMYSGASLDWNFHDKVYDAEFTRMKHGTFTPYIDFGLGIRINHIQVNLGTSVDYSDIADAYNFSNLILDRCRKATLSVSYMF
jgi:hypothetical protein